MAFLTELMEWVAGIRRIEKDDPVEGGEDGISNIQAKQLAARTNWLKQQVEAAQGDMAAHLVAADPHAQYATEAWVAAQLDAVIEGAPGSLNTLNELAAAMGDDPNFAATVINQLALKAPLSSPAFTDAPTAPTPQIEENSTRLATTSWVRTAMSSIATAAGFVCSLTQNGYIKFPSWLGGLIIQWGETTYVNTAGGAITFPMSFPNACFFVTCSISEESGNYAFAQAVERTLSGFSSVVYTSTVGSAPSANTSITAYCSWLSVGR